jgi:dihydroorotate dehydrogenase electron transfer subunit
MQPGQFVMIRTSAGSDPLLRRPFSIFERLVDQHGTPIGITILNKRVGVGTSALYAATSGSHLDCLGPLGNTFTAIDPPQDAWMVAGGVGLAPFATLAERLAARRVRCTLFYGGRRASDLYYVDTFERLGVRVVLSTEDGSRGERGRVTVPLERALKQTDAPVMIYACGPEGMLAAVARLARQYGQPSEIATERVMGCGLGGCYSCVIKVKSDSGSPHFVRSCLAGPVFRGDDLVWD